MIRKILFSAMLAFVAFSFISWGVVGHRAIGRIAEKHLSAKAKAGVAKLLGTESLPMVTTYSDEVRSYPDYSHTAPWHYVNIPLGYGFDEFSAKLKSLETPNVYKSINNCVADLKNPAKSEKEKTFALKFLIHLVGDLHQPFHTGRAEDSGGNSIGVRLMRRETNMHSLWDSGLIDYTGMSWSELAVDCDRATAAQVSQWQKDDITRWAFESYEIATVLYAEAAKNPEFDFTYYPAHELVVKKRISQAGVRLAGILNGIYK